MATTIPRDQEQLQRELDERRRRAWAVYAESTRHLDGEAYDEAESRSWERLRRELDEIERARVRGLSLLRAR